MNAKVDYELGGAYAPPSGVVVVSRDRKMTPAEGVYTICYVNGFQIQPDEQDDWLARHPQLVLRDHNGKPVIDPDWHEMLLDIRTADKRAAIARIVGDWIRQCQAAGFAAIEIDNLDSYVRSKGLLSTDDAVEMMRLFAEAAHAVGLPIAQKNASDLVARKAEMGTDFAIVEECNRYAECDTYTDAYGDHVIVIEYRRQDFEAGCAAYPNLSIVLRDRDLVTPESAGYVYESC